MITCQECEAEFDVTHENITEPEFCPFCGSKLRFDDPDDNWYEEDDDVMDP